MAHHPAAGGHQDEKESPEQFGEETTPLLAGIVEVGDAIDDLLFVPSYRSEFWNFL